MTFAVNTQNKSNSEFKSRLLPNVTCTFCHRVGHDESTYFGKNGFPEWWGDRSQTRGRGGPGRGRIAVGAVLLRHVRGRLRLRLSLARPGGMSRVLRCKPDDRLTGKLLSDVWIIDSGASNHVTGNLLLLSNLRDMPPCTVSLPDGKKVTSSKCGSARLSSSLTLHTVYYVPNFDCNLLSVTHLTEDIDCVVYCVKYDCLIQDQRSRMLIGLSERWGGLYYFRRGTVQANGAVNK
ncbi:hypothetical protein LIER_22692 [Lithospermum erythrorhizon]|uniref:Retrovirus-related Pol polyprotein from transposon TNT 1-94-like beta-barrel domain-containing protein n=1 Tax=Lithospermum erythrorhizon TaxID=34254 RepID=A0AAV3QXT8_LITER